MSAQIPRLIVVSDVETARLIRHAQGRYLALSFGPRGVWLQPDAATGAPISTWAPPLLDVWRAAAFEQGAGI